jgi:hypothetical protein
MGNFSQDPTLRAADALAKQYVGVRIQQAVPLVDADWNLLEDLRRVELESYGRLFIGDGVPVGSDGFRISAVAGTNDFAIGAGVLLAGGKLVRNDAAVTYTTQPHFGDPDLVPPLAALATPAASRAFLVVLDVWEREVDSEEDVTLVDPRIGVETTVRLKREWAVRVFRDPEDAAQIAAPPPGHAFVVLAKLNRTGGNANITSAMIVDLRDTQLTLLRRVDVRDGAGNVVVDNQRFGQMLAVTRNNVRALIRYVATTFNSLSATMTGAEILALEAAAHVAHTAEAGLAQLAALTLANRAALTFFRQLHEAQQKLMEIWRDVLLQLGSPVKKYASYNQFVGDLNARLNDPIVGTLTGLLPAIDTGNLAAAVTMQEEIARLIGFAGASVARGSIQVAYLGGPPGNLVAGQVARFEFRVRSFLTQADVLTVEVLPEDGWSRILVDAASNPIPNSRISLGASGAETPVFVNVTPESTPGELQLRVVSDSNPAEIIQFSTLLSLNAGQPAPAGEDKVRFQLENAVGAVINPITGVVTVPKPAAGGQSSGSVGVRIFNTSGSTATFSLSVSVVPGTQVGTWTIAHGGDSTRTLANGADARPGRIDITAGDDAVSVQARYVATATVGAVQISAQFIVAIAVASSPP